MAVTLTPEGRRAFERSELAKLLREDRRQAATAVQWQSDKESLFEASFGGKTASANRMFQLAQNIAAGDDLLDVLDDADIPSTVDVSAGGRVIKDYSGSLIAQIKTLKVGAPIRFSSGAMVGDIDALKKSLRWIYRQLVGKTPVLSGTMRQSYILTMGDPTRILGRSLPSRFQDDSPILGVTNLASWAVVREHQDNSPFLKTMRVAQRRYKGEFDVRMRFLAGEDLPRRSGVHYQIAQNPRPETTGNPRYYAAPVIEIAFLGRMGGLTGNQWTKRRKRKRRNSR
jgi:hypothetical protein